MFACVTSVASSLLFLSPVLMMVGFVLYAKFRHRGEDELTSAAVESAAVLEREPVLS